MRIIAKSRLMALARAYGDCVEQVEAWHQVASKAVWRNVSEVRKAYPHADPVGRLTVFNIKGNAYRLIVEMHYDKGIIYIRDLLTHAEYDKDAWK